MEAKNNNKEQTILDNDIQKNSDVAAFSWTLIFAPILLVLRKDSEFIQFHSRQAVILFIIGVIIFAFPSPYSRLNILTVVAAIIGFLNANQGKWYKMPLIYDLVEKGITPAKILYALRDFSVNIFGIIKRIFTKGGGGANQERVISKEQSSNEVNPLVQENLILQQKISFLETEFLKEKYLHGNKKADLSKEAQEKLAQIEKIFLTKKYQKEEQGDLIGFSNKENQVFFGDFDESGGLMFFNFGLKKEDSDLVFGHWCGIGVMFADTDASLKKIQNLIK